MQARDRPALRFYFLHRMQGMQSNRTPDIVLGEGLLKPHIFKWAAGFVDSR